MDISAYHSSWNDWDDEKFIVCSMALLPLNTEVNGPAPAMKK